MLPLWYLLVWPVTLTKWVAAVSMGDVSDAELYAGLYRMLFEASQDSRFD